MRLQQFTYGYGRIEDLAGVAVILIILFSAIVAGYEAIQHLTELLKDGQQGYKISGGQRRPSQRMDRYTHSSRPE